jgi:hypothetical protein
MCQNRTSRESLPTPKRIRTAAKRGKSAIFAEEKIQKGVKYYIWRENGEVGSKRIDFQGVRGG